MVKLRSKFIIFNWRPPDLSPGSSWTRETLLELRAACDHYPNSDDLYKDGLERLQRHRRNYDAEGPNPTHLQLLWWEFPPERWDELRDGCRMQFWREPTPIIQPNSDVTEEQLETTEEFILELASLGILLEVVIP